MDYENNDSQPEDGAESVPVADETLFLWEGLVASVERANERFDFAGAVDLSWQALGLMEGYSCQRALQARGLSFTRLAGAYLHAGQPSEATAPLVYAAKAFSRVVDSAGLVEVLSLQHDVSCALGRPQEAADALSRAAAIQARHSAWDAAAALSKRAAALRGGLPRVRAVAVSGGVEYELDEAPLDEPLVIELRRDRPTLKAADAAIRAGAILAAKGALRAAARRFADAVAIDPSCPDAPWRRGVCLLHLGEAGAAVDALELSEAVGGGWQSNRADLWLARRIEAKPSLQSVFETLRALRSGTISKANRLALATEATLTTPEIGAVWLAFGEVAWELGQKKRAKAALEVVLQSPGDPETRGRAALLLASLTDDARTERVLLETARRPISDLTTAAKAEIRLRRYGYR